MHPHVLHRQPASFSARVARAATFALCRAAARLYRATQDIGRPEPPEEERHCVRALLASHGKLD